MSKLLGIKDDFKKDALEPKRVLTSRNVAEQVSSRTVINLKVDKGDRHDQETERAAH